MHISDTTEGIYKYIDRVIQEINPQYIVHTGDIVDNIKLETNADYLYLHQKGLSLFQDVIKKYRGNIYYALGNHDDRESVKSILNGGIIVSKELITIEGKVFSMSHKYEMLQKKADYYLFGHSFDPCSYEKSGEVFLNGLTKINIIVLSTGRIYELGYPVGVNYERKMEKRSVGL